MARILIDTSTLSTATAYSNQRKIVKTSAGKLILFANLGNTSDTRIRYKTSDDNGDIWITRDSFGQSFNFYYSISVDGGLIWTTTPRSLANVNYCSVCIPVGSDI